jgi:hypothetical protein
MPHRPLQDDRPLQRRHTVLLRGGKPNNGDAGRSDCGVCHHIGGKSCTQPTATRANVGFATDTVANSFRTVFSAARVRFATACTASSGLGLEDQPRAGGSASGWRISLELEGPRPERGRPGAPRFYRSRPARGADVRRAGQGAGPGAGPVADGWGQWPGFTATARCEGEPTPPQPPQPPPSRASEAARARHSRD